MKLQYDQPFISALLNYLATHPYAQVAQFIAALQAGEVVEEKKVVEGKKEE